MATITTTQLVKTISGMAMLGYLSTGAIATAQIPLFEGLPPLPPSIPTLQDTPKDDDVKVDFESEQLFEADDLEVLPIAQPPALTEFSFEAPTAQPHALPSRAIQNGYRVEVASNDRNVLNVVRTVEPEAFMRGDRIQAGLFTDKNNARTLQSNLRNQGLNARIVDVDSTAKVPVTRVSDRAIGGSSMDNSDYDAGYFVAIPIRGSAANLRNQVLNTGVNANLVQAQESVRGDFIAIGPFSNRQEATSVNAQVRAASLDGRLYFRR